MLTFYIGNDNAIVRTEATSAIVEKSNAVDSIRFITPKLYNDEYEMANYDVILEYVTPITKRNSIIQLVLTDDNYKDDYLLYTLPTTQATTALTAETGELEFSLTFIQAELDVDGNTVERVRNSANNGTIKIVPITSWFNASKEALAELTAMYVENKKVAEALAEVASIINANKADDIRLDENDKSLYLTANNVKIGTEIDLETLNNILVAIGGNSPNSGNVVVNQI